MRDGARGPMDADALAAAFARTLEEAAFVFAERSDDPPPFEGEVLEARLAWSGPDAGELRLTAEPALAAALAANLLGVDDAEGRGADALGELLNMAAGAVVLELFGPREARRLLLPAVRVVDAATHASARAGAAVSASLLEESGRRIDVALAPAPGSVA